LREQAYATSLQLGASLGSASPQWNLPILGSTQKIGFLVQFSWNMTVLNASEILAGNDQKGEGKTT
jgi:hypothetical protein